MDKAPGCNTRAAATSVTRQRVCQAVAVAGLATTGTPDGSAGTVFSHRHQDGKLNLPMNNGNLRV